MATLFEIDNEILSCIDQDTGEIIDAAKLNDLQMQREKKIEGVALWVKNLTSDAEAYKAEKDSFAEKERTTKNKIESLKNWLSIALNGEKFTPESRKVSISFRKSEQVKIDNEDDFVEWAKYSRDDLLTFKEPAINKTAVKQAIKDGLKFGGVAIVENQNIQIK